MALAQTKISARFFAFRNFTMLQKQHKKAFTQADRALEISKHGQARRQEFAMGGGAVLGVWGQSPQLPEARGLEAKPPALKNVAFFCKNNLILELF